VVSYACVAFHGYDLLETIRNTVLSSNYFERFTIFSLSLGVLMNKSAIHHRKLRSQFPKFSAIGLALTVALISCNTAPKNTDANGARKPWKSADANAAAVHAGFLTDQAWVSATNGWGPVERGRSNGSGEANDGANIKLAGQEYTQGFGIHADSSITFNLDPSCSSFQASIGLDDEVRWQSEHGSVIFRVYGGQQQLFDSGAMDTKTATKDIAVDLRAGQYSTLTLMVDQNRNSTEGDFSGWQDHADWANARVECASSSNPPPPAPPTASGPTTTASYAQSLENFPNPERGFAFENDVAWPAQTPWGFCGQGDNFARYNYTAWNDPLNLGFLQQERSQGRSVVMSRYHIADFRNRDLTAEYLNFLQRDFDTARQAGVKIGMRFAYNYPMGGPDAPLAVILRHIGQLQPLFVQNADVIAYLEAGFVGCWGEWHHSANGLTGDNTSRDGYISDGGRQIVSALLGALPKERMIALRYPRLKFDYFGSSDWLPIAPLTASQAFNGSNRARIGHHDDCFVCSDTHGGAYLNPRGDLGEVPRFLEPENLFVVQAGEPGDIEADPNLGSCQTILQELSSKHWSVVGLFNLASSASVIERWKRDGCYEEISRNLGYRYRLSSSEISSRASRGGAIQAKLSVSNDGWSNLYNPRTLELVLRSQTSGAVRRLKLVDDARLTMPFPGQTKTLEFTVNVPADLAAAKYDVLLALPDPTASLHDRPEYAIQLANQGVWESSTGWNKLGHTLEIQ
jgi:Domain of unknown function (DUF4832)/NPCBM/NEW2 domain/Domain of unknown function (DUF4874)